MGTHRGDSDRLSFRQWRRYRRELAALVRRERRGKRPLTPDRIRELKAEARKTARLTGE